MKKINTHNGSIYNNTHINHINHNSTNYNTNNNTNSNNTDKILLTAKTVQTIALTTQHNNNNS